MFGKKRAARSETTQDQNERLERKQSQEKADQRRSALRDELGEIAKRYELKILENKEELLAKAHKDNAFQNANFHFECRRYGDFLLLAGDRKRQDETEYERHNLPTKIMTSISLRSVSQIYLIEGEPVQQTGIVHYDYDAVNLNDPSLTEFVTSDGAFYVWAKIPKILRNRPLLSQNPVPESLEYRHMFGRSKVYNPISNEYHDKTIVPHVTHDIAKPMQDASIVFQGSTVLHVPHDLAADVYKEIMTEIQRGWEYHALPNLTTGG